MRSPRSKGWVARRWPSWSPSARRGAASKTWIGLSRRLDARSFNRRQFESLAKAGAFDSLNPNRGKPSPRQSGCCVRRASRAAHLKRVIVPEAGGRGRVTVVLDLPSRAVETAIPGSFKVDPKTRAAVGSLPGIVDVHDI
jgi:hypothetical protein